MAQNPMPHAEDNARALRASQTRREPERKWARDVGDSHVTIAALERAGGLSHPIIIMFIFHIFLS